MPPVPEYPKSKFKNLKLINNPVRRFDYVQKLEFFLISAVLTILVIRTQLWLTNYPQLGGGGLHIAHLLYGGIFMMIAIWISLIYVNRSARSATAIIGGIGFGFFIDELGKFITEDNDYFFKPAAGIIYIVFILMFLTIRELSRRQKLNPRAALANAVAFLPATITGEFRQQQYEQAMELLTQSDPADPLVASTREYYERVNVAPDSPPSRLQVMIVRVQAWVTRQTERPRFEKTVIAVVIIWGILQLAGASALGFAIEAGDSTTTSISAGSSSFFDVAWTISILVSVGFVAMGSYCMWRNQHQRAYRHFGRALLVSIFVTRVFSFIESQFGAAFGLGVDIILYSAISELANRDSQTKHYFGGIEQSELPVRQNDDDGKKAQTD